MTLTSVVLLVLLGFLLQLSSVQTFFAQKAAAYLSDKLGTPVLVDRVSIYFFDRASLKNVLVLDQQQDTLLYAGALDVRLNNFFFLRENPTLEGLAIRDAQVLLKRPRQHEVWNYQYIADAFATGQKDSSSSTALPEWQVQQVSLEQVRFSYVDQWVGMDYYVNVDAFELNGDHIDYKARQVIIDAIEGDGITIGMLDYTGGRPPQKRIPRVYKLSESTPFNPDNWKFEIKNLEVADSRFYLEYPEDVAIPDFFDHLHIDITGVDVKVKDISIEGDTIKGNVTSLHALERSGLAVQEFKSKVRVSPNISECSNLYLRTNNSVITNYYAMEYNHFPDFLNYIEQVKMKGNFVNAKIGINDILYFTDALERIRNHQLVLDGSAVGTVAHLSSPEVKITDGTNTVTGDFTIKNIPDVDNIHISVEKAVVTGNSTAAMKYVPELESYPNLDLSQLGSFKIDGSFDGMLNEFGTRLDVESEAGRMAADFDFKDVYHNIRYQGQLSSDRFNIGAILKVKEVGYLSMQTELSGVGMEIDKSRIDFNTAIGQIEVAGYDYKDIEIYGSYQDKAFTGSATVNDDHLNLDIDNGKIYVENNRTFYDIDAKLNHINTQALHWTNHNLVGSAEVNLNFTGTHIDDFTGSVLFYNMEVTRDEQPINLNQFYLSATMSHQKKNVSFLTNGIEVSLNGDFKLTTLPYAFLNYFSQYFPNYLTRNEIADVQDVTFTIQTKQSDDFFKFINLPVKLSPGANITGKLVDANNYMTLMGTIPYFSIADYNFTNGNIKIWGDEDRLNQEVELEKLSYGAYEIASELEFSSEYFNNNGNFSLKTQSVNTLGNAEIQGNIRGEADSFYVTLKPSNILFNHKRWEIESPDVIVLSNDYLYLNNIRLHSGQQVISLNEHTARPNEVVIGLAHVETNPINNLLNITDFYINGNLNGRLQVTDIFNTQQASYQLDIDTLMVDDVKFGQVNIVGTANLKNQTFSLAPQTYVRSDLGTVFFDVFANYGQDNPSLKGSIRIDEAPVEWVQPFVKGYVHDMKGSFGAVLKLGGSIYKPEYTGSVSLKDVMVVPDITGVTYYIDRHKVEVENSTIKIEELKVRDALYNKGTLNGTIAYKGWDQYLFNLTMESDKIQVLNLDKAENDYFYGNIYAQTYVTLTGQIDNLRMNVVGKPHAGSKLFIPISSEGDYSNYEYITFKKHGEYKKKQLPNSFVYNLKIDAIATPDLEAIIILDESTGDKLQVVGTGNVVMEIPSNGAITLNGNYVIDHGAYNFAFKQMEVLNYKQKFDLEQGSVIKWTGDLYDADLDIKANAQVKAKLYDLIANETDRLGLNDKEISDAQIPQMINIRLDMQGALSQPQLSFKLGLVESRSIGTYAYQKLQRINSSERELLNQVAGLLILKQFLPPEGFINNSNISSGAITNMSELFSTTASSQLSNLANKLLGVEDLYINLKYKNYSLLGYDPNNPANYTNRNEAGVNVRKNFFKNRLVTEVGGIYDWGNNSTNYNLAGNFKVQYLLTKDGRIRMNAFSTNNYDAVYQKNINRQGAGLMFKRSFSSWQGLFSNRIRINTTQKNNTDTLQSSDLNEDK